LIKNKKSKKLKKLCWGGSAAPSEAHHGRPSRLLGGRPPRGVAADGRRASAADVHIGWRMADGQVRGRTRLAVRRLGGGRFRFGGGRFRLGGGWPIQGVVCLTPPHFHLPLTTSDVLQLLLALVAPMWWRVGVLFVIIYTRFYYLHCGAQS
jgi:hypothetical protein